MSKKYSVNNLLMSAQCPRDGIPFCPQRPLVDTTGKGGGGE
jgi:hypothetical protein